MNYYSKTFFMNNLHMAIGNRRTLKSATATKAMFGVRTPPSKTNVMYEARLTKNGARDQTKYVPAL